MGLKIKILLLIILAFAILNSVAVSAVPFACGITANVPGAIYDAAGPYDCSLAPPFDIQAPGVILNMFPGASILGAPISPVIQVTLGTLTINALGPSTIETLPGPIRTAIDATGGTLIANGNGFLTSDGNIKTSASGGDILDKIININGNLIVQGNSVTVTDSMITATGADAPLQAIVGVTGLTMTGVTINGDSPGTTPAGMNLDISNSGINIILQDYTPSPAGPPLTVSGDNNVVTVDWNSADLIEDIVKFDACDTCNFHGTSTLYGNQNFLKITDSAGVTVSDLIASSLGTTTGFIVNIDPSFNTTIANSTLANAANCLIIDTSNTTLVDNVTFMNCSVHAINITNGSSNNEIRNSTFINNTIGIGIYGESYNNTVYWNTFTNLSTPWSYFAFDGNSVPFNNFFNISVGGKAQGNYWADVFYNNLQIYDTDGDGFGDSGAQYPYESANGGNVSGVRDYGPRAPSQVITCGQNISVNTMLTQNITCNGTALYMPNSSVTLDCSGYTITGNGTGNGIYILGGFDNVIVKNCEILNFSKGVYLQSSSYANATLLNNTIRNNSQGISELNNIYNLTLINNTVNNTIDLVSTTDNVMSIPDNNRIYLINQSIDTYNFSLGFPYLSGSAYFTVVSQYGILHLLGMSGGAGGNLTKHMVVSNNRVFVNSTANPNLNKSANITLYNITMPNPEPFYDPEDDGSFAACPANICTEQNYTGTTYKFNVSQFTTYKAQDVSIACNSTISTNTTLTANLTCNGTALNINTSGIVLDCEGRTITGNSSGDGISFTGLSSVIIKNCIIHNFTRGIYSQNSKDCGFYNDSAGYSQRGYYIDSMNNSLFLNNSAYFNEFDGFYLMGLSGGCNNNTLINNTAWNNSGAFSGTGFLLEGFSVLNKYNRNNKLIDNFAYDNNAYGFSLETNNEYNNLTGNIAKGNVYQGIQIYYSNYNNLTNNSVYNNSGAGLLLHHANDCFLTENRAYDNPTGISLYISHYNTLINNSGYNNNGFLASGINLDESNYNNLTNNTAYNNSHIGIFLDESNFNTLRNNTAFMNGEDGIRLLDSDDDDIYNNTVHNNSQNGILIYKGGSPPGSNVHVVDNIIYNNTRDGVYIYNTADETVISNDITSNSRFGIHIETSNNTLVRDNTVLNNTYSINLTDANSNTIYNNFFENEPFADAASTGNSWNITKTLGTNIINGPYFGGNFWLSYNGTDTDNDGLGDTEIPWKGKNNEITNGGDDHPLYATYVQAIQCEFETSGNFVNCSTAIYGANVTRIRVNCTDTITQDGTATMSNATINMTNIPDSQTFVYGTTSSVVSGYYTLDHADFQILDSGLWQVAAICTDTTGLSKSGARQFDLPYGNLSNAVMLAPPGNYNAPNGSIFTATCTVQCTGGECVNTTVTLDPIVNNITPSYPYKTNDAFFADADWSGLNNVVYFNNTNNAASSAAVTGDQPMDVDIDINGNVIIVDSGNNNNDAGIYKLTPAGVLSVVKNVSGGAGWAGSMGLTGIAIDANGNYIMTGKDSGSNYAIMIYNITDGSDSVIYNGPFPDNLDYPYGIDIDQYGNYIVVGGYEWDESPTSNGSYIAIYNITDSSFTQINSTTQAGGAGSGLLGYMTGVKVDANGEYIVSDGNYNSLYKINRSGQVAVITTGLTGGWGVSIDSNGDYIVTDNNGIKRVSAAGGLITNLNTGGYMFPMGAEVILLGGNMVISVNSVSIIPPQMPVHSSVYCSANITTQGTIDTVQFNLTYPNGTSVLLGFSNVSGIYNSSAFDVNSTLDYVCTVTANTTLGWSDSLSLTFHGGNKGMIPMNSGSPFYTTSQNPVNGSNQSCLNSLVPGQTCNSTWNVTTNGTIGQTWAFFCGYNGSENGIDTLRSNVTITAEEQPNITANKTDTPDPVYAGNQLNYTITYFNNGTANASSFVVTEIYPPQVTFVSAVPSPTSGNNTWTIGTVANGTGGTINITVLVNATVSNNTNITNFVNFTYYDPPGLALFDGETNETTLVLAPPAPPNPNMTISKTDDPDPVYNGTNLNYTITFCNNGTDNAGSVIINDTYDANTSYVSATPTPDPGTNNTWTIVTVTPGNCSTINITVLVNPAIANNTNITNVVNLTYLNASGDIFYRGDSEITLALRTPVPTPPTPTSSGGGGGATRRYIPVNQTPQQPVVQASCLESWLCDGWSPCENNMQMRSCIDLKNCGTTTLKPGESRNCTPVQQPVLETPAPVPEPIIEKPREIIAPKIETAKRASILSGIIPYLDNRNIIRAIALLVMVSALLYMIYYWSVRRATTTAEWEGKSESYMKKQKEIAKKMLEGKIKI